MSSNVLFTGVTVAGYEVKPWGLGQIARAAPHLAQVLATAREMKFDLAAAMRAPDKVDQVKSAELMLRAMPAIVELLVISIKQPVTTVEEFDAPTSMRLIKAVFTVNRDYLKNSFAPAGVAAGAGASKETATS